MLFINDILVTEEDDIQVVEKSVKSYLTEQKLVIMNEDNHPMNEEELQDNIANYSGTLKLTAITTSMLLREFKGELHNYILKVEDYIGDTRETEDFSTVSISFIQATEALLEFEVVAEFLQKKLINQQTIQDISRKALEQAKIGNSEYILDLLEYELLPILNHFINETNEEM